MKKWNWLGLVNTATLATAIAAASCRGPSGGVPVGFDAGDAAGATHDAGATHPPPPLSSCTVTTQGEHQVLTFSTGVECDARLGACAVGLTLVETVDVDPKGRTSSDSFVFERSGQVVLKVGSRTAHGQTRVTVQYGPAFQGISHVDLRSDGTRLVGKIDGRDIAPVLISKKRGVSPELTFRDRKPAGKVTVAPEIERGIERLLRQADSGIPKLCRSAVAAGAGVAAVAERTLARGILPYSSPADVPLPVNSGDLRSAGGQGCDNCQNNCNAALAACDGGVLGGCIAALWGYGACAASGFIACSAVAALCLTACDNAGGSCCPLYCPAAGQCCNVDDQCAANAVCCPNFDLVCGGACCNKEITECNNNTCCPKDTVPCGPTCCGAGEKCADSIHGWCCPAGTNTCGGGCCGNVGDVCVQTKPRVCCAPGDVACGEECCGQGQSCMKPNNVCCATPLCGGFCCDQGTCINGACCIGAVAGGSCCGLSQVPCGGSCCDGACINGTCCPAAQEACGSVCCPPGSACLDPRASLCTTCPAGRQACQDVITGSALCCPGNVACCNGACCAAGEQCCEGSCRTNCIIP